MHNTRDSEVDAGKNAGMDLVVAGHVVAGMARSYRRGSLGLDTCRTDYADTAMMDGSNTHFDVGAGHAREQRSSW